jgi:hypothetical protein
MQITIETSGGFAALPGLARPITIDTASLDAKTAAALHALIVESTFFELPPLIDTTQQGAADFLTYQISVDDGSSSHTVRFTEPVLNPLLERLLALVQAIVHAAK